MFLYLQISIRKWKIDRATKLKTWKSNYRILKIKTLLKMLQIGSNEIAMLIARYLRYNQKLSPYQVDKKTLTNN